jgi:signal transduction histidine kinase
LFVARKLQAQRAREDDKREIELRHAQKLEAVGQLAAGIAHEMSTPIQFVGDSVRFLENAFRDLTALLLQTDRVIQAAPHSPEIEALAVSLAEARGQADLAYLLDRVPKAVARVSDGIDRVATIVRAMKEFSHPDQREQEPADLNRAIDVALIVCRSEYRHVAELTFDPGDLPLCTCHAGDIQQVVVNLVVNAAHAIEDAARRTGTPGAIRIATTYDADDGCVVMSVTDNGTGIRKAIRHRIFDPFFTTKAVGRGTGQGLAISHAIVVERHGGRLSFDSELGAGTTFYVRLPIAGRGTAPIGHAGSSPTRATS